MKAKTRYVSCILMFALLTSILYAQTPGKKQSENLTLKNSVAQTSNISYYPQTISWWDSGNGLICKVSVDNMSHITRYDKQGKYVETLTQKEWNDTSILLSSFQQSQYKLQKVTGYWEVSDANKKGYYLEMNDSKNQGSSVWVDDQGKFSIIPGSRPKQ